MRIPFTKLRISVGPLIAPLAAAMPKVVVVPILSGPARGIRWQVGSGMTNFWLGTYEREKYQAFANEIREGMVVYDIGANVGAYTVLAARKVGREGQVYAFEPDVQNVSRLSRNVELNHFANCTVMPAAVSDVDRFSWFETGKDSCIGRLSNEGKILVSCVSLDHFIAMGNPAPDLIKMDVEGGEWDALNGAKILFSAKRPLIFLATHGTRNHRQCCDFLRERGYSLCFLAPDEIVATARGNFPLSG